MLSANLDFLSEGRKLEQTNMLIYIYLLTNSEHKTTHKSCNDIYPSLSGSLTMYIACSKGNVKF